MPQGWLPSTYLMCLTDPVSWFPSQSCFNLFCLVCSEQNDVQQEGYSWDKGKQVEGLITCPQVLMVDVRGDDLMDCQSWTVNDWIVNVFGKIDFLTAILRIYRLKIALTLVMVKGKYQQTATFGQPAMKRDINCNNIIPRQCYLGYSGKVHSVTAERNWMLMLVVSLAYSNFQSVRTQH